MTNNIVSVKNLRVQFNSTKNKKQTIEIVRGVDFEIPPKSIVGFIGESGSGKSVTAKTLLGINANSKTTADKMEVAGIDLLENVKGKKVLTSKKSVLSMVRGKRVAYIPQDSLTSLNPTMKIGAQIMEALIKHSDGTKTKEELKEHAIFLLEKFGVSNARKRFNSYPHEFSGGMRQRVVIAMMVACKPDVIIADEPTTALDPTVQASVLSLFQDIVRDFDTSIIFISHDIAVIATLCDHINVFYAGRIVEKGTKKDIFTNPKHPYTWSLLAAIPDAKTNQKELFTIPGQPPSFENLPSGDPFSVRNPFALKIDFIKEPPLFKVSDTHYAATWLLHPDSPKLAKPEVVEKLIQEISKEYKNVK